jgi:hypothetical protein
LNLRPSGYEPDELPGCSTPRRWWWWCVWIRPGGPAATDSPAAWAAVPWALGRFTAEFGMGSGVPSPRWPPGHRAGSAGSGASRARAGACMRARSIGRLVRCFRGPPVAAARRCARRGPAKRGRPRRRCDVVVVVVVAMVWWWRGRPAALAGALRLRVGSPFGRLGPLGCAHRCASTCGLSTCWSGTALGETWFGGGFPA